MNPWEEYQSGPWSDYKKTPEPNLATVKQAFSENLSKPTTKDDGTKQAGSFMDYLDAGYQMSVTGLMKRGKMPDVLMPEDAPMWAKIASQTGQLAGDIPAMVVGAWMGSEAGGAVGGIAGGAIGAAGGGVGALPGAATGAAVGSSIGSSAGAFALPAYLRRSLIDNYQKGAIKDAKDFWGRQSAAFLDAYKQAEVGALTAGAGMVVGPAVKAIASPTVASAAKLASEITTMVTMGKAVEGQLPNKEDFLTAAVMVGGMHLATLSASGLSNQIKRISTKSGEVYAKTGVMPDEMIRDAQANPVIRQELASSNIEIPNAYTSRIDPSMLEKLEPISVTPAMSKPVDIGGNEGGVSLKPAEKVSTPAIEQIADDSFSVVKSRISFEPTPKKGMTLDKLYTNMLDNLHPIKQLRDVLAGDEPVIPKDDPYILARLTRGSYGRADQFLEFSPFKFDTLENTGKSLSKVLEPVREDIDNFRAYAVSRRALELNNRGIETGISPEAAREVVNANPKYQEAFSQLQEYQTKTLEYLRDSGIVSKEGFEKMQEANKDYVPFYRLMDDKPSGPDSAGKGLSVKAPIKGIKGSERMIVDPIESIVKNTYLYVQLAERNRALTALANLAESAGDRGSELMERIPAPMKGITVREPEIARFMKEQGIEGDPAEFSIFRQANRGLANDEIALFRDGQKEIYRVSPEVATAVRALDQESVGMLTKMASIPAQYLRAGTTLSPEFVARNFMRDQLTAFNLGSNGFRPVFDTLRGLGSIFKKDEDYQNWLKSGGANSAMVSVDRQYVEENVLKIAKETGMMSHAWNVVKSPIELMKVTSELIENSTRLGAFKRAMDETPNATTSDIFSAGYEAREVTLDFQRIGAKTRAMNMITAFWNASAQGLDKTVRSFGDRPLETSMKLTASVTLPSVLLWYANHDDPRYKEVPSWQKDLFWLVMTKDHIYRIPKPMELGILFGSLPERALDKFYDEKPDAFKGLSGDFMGALTPSFLPTFAVPVIEQFANRSTFTGNAIVPHSLEGLLPEYQYTDYTTESGKLLGKLVATVPGMKDSQLSSPSVIENYARAWSGQLGSYALKLADQALIKSGAITDPIKPTPSLADIPVVKAFVVRYPSAGAQSIQDFYDRYGEVQTRMNTIKHLAKEGDFMAAQKEMRLAEEADLVFNLAGIKEALGNQTRFIQMVYKNKDMTPDEKRQIIDGSYYMMIKMTQQGNALIDRTKETLK